MADRYWDGSTDGDWNTAAHWTPAAVPIAGENVFITDTAVDIDDYDNSAVALGIVTIGPGYTGNIGTSAGTGLILSCAASKRIVIDGNRSLTSQEVWLDYNSANATTIEVKGFGTITEAGMATTGIHITQTAGTLAVINSGGPVSVDGGTVANYDDAGSTAQTIVSSAATITNYKMMTSGAITTLNVSPTTLEVSEGTVTAEGSGNVVNVEVWSGVLNWNGGGNITTKLTVRGGTFDTSDATVSTAIADIEVFGDSTTTTLDLTLATVTNNIEFHGSPTVINPPASLGTLT